MKIKIALSLVFLYLFIGCTTDTYKIVNAEYSYESNIKSEGQFKEITPLLINTKTGDVWELIPEEESEKAGYKWIKQNKE